MGNDIIHDRTVRLGMWLLGALVGLSTIVAGGYFAASMRPAAASVLAGVVFTAVVVLMLTMEDSAPLWYQLTFLFVGPLAAWLGGTLCATRQRRRVD